MTIDPNYHSEKQKYKNPVASREYILQILQNAKKPLSFMEICERASATTEDNRVGIQRRLRAMEREGQVRFTRQKKYQAESPSNLIKGRVIGHRDGYGFLKHSDTEKDYFINQSQMQNLLHDDVVEGVILDSDRKGRVEFRVNRVLEPRSDRIVGRFFNEQGVSLVIPDDNRIQHEIIIPPQSVNGARQGNIVVVEVQQRPNRKKTASGKITEVLGKHMAPGMEIEMALRNFDIPHKWPKGVTSQVAKISDYVSEEAKVGRTDLTDLPLITIDGEDARDFDDAVFCRKKHTGGWTLWVAIADVSSYVKTGTALDEEAKNRGTSVYFPEQVVPMLPEILSNGLCSLNPDVDRLCMVCEIEVDSEGELTDYKFYEAFMRSHARLTYNKVWGILNGDSDLRRRYQARVKELETLYDLYKARCLARRKRGAIEFETIESKFVFNAERKISHIIPVERNDAHKIIEQCMILANVCAASFIEANDANALFRVHGKPDEDRLTTFKTYLSEVGIPYFLDAEPSPLQFSAIMSKLADRSDKELIQTMLLRSMKQAIYAPENGGHFGLSLEAYAHFTSPIRRYPDLVVHRCIKSILGKHVTSNSGAKSYSLEEAEQLGEHCSMTERRADDATRDVSDWLKCEFMQDHIGSSFEGVIASVTNFGIFVRITEYHIDGLVHITSLGNDYYIYDESKQTLTGESSGISYRLGDSLEVQVASVNLDERKIDLVIENNDDTHSKKPGKLNAKKRLKAVSKKRERNKKNSKRTARGNGKD